MRFRQSLFWDTDPKKIDKKKHAKYIIERILDFGTEGEMRWMTGFYSSRLIKKVLDTSRVVFDKDRRLWRMVYSGKPLTMRQAQFIVCARVKNDAQIKELVKEFKLVVLGPYHPPERSKRHELAFNGFFIHPSP